MERTGSSFRDKLLIAMPWAFLPLLAMHFASTWSALPPQIAVHFDVQGRPNGWQSPTAFAIFALVFLTFMLAVLTFTTWRALRLRSLAIVAVLMMYVVSGIVFTLLSQTLDYAAYRRPMSDVWPFPAIFPAGALVFALIALVAGSSSAPTVSSAANWPQTLIAEEQHRSLTQLLFIIPGIGIGIYLLAGNYGPMRYIGIFLIAVMSWIAVAVLEGFRYLVRADGVQIKGFLLPLRFVPRSAIRSYHAERWNGLGYGIRLTSTGTAYIWGGRDVVNIVTDSGDVLLGHAEPERLIRDLDRMMHTTQ